VYEPATAVFSTFKGQRDGQQPAQNSPRSRSKPTTCFCGKNYWFKDCWHLNKNARRRPKDFTPDPKVIAQAQQEISSNRRRAAKLQEVMELSRPTASPSASSNTLVCTTIASTAVNTIPKYSHKDSFIIDSGAAISVCNNINWFNNFTKKYEAIGVGSKVNNCLGIGTITIRPNIGGRDLNGVSLTIQNI
jgi:hypothetical protein